MERWSRGSSGMHALDARAKIVALLAVLVGVATLPPGGLAWGAPALAAMVVAGAVAGRLPLPGVLGLASLVLPFSLTFAAIAWFTGDGARAVSMLVKSYLSAMAVLVVTGTTPLPALLHGSRLLGAPPVLVLVVQFLYRYLFVIAGEAEAIRYAAASRGASSSFRVAAGGMGTLFLKSYHHAGAIHGAMLARGFSGDVPLLFEPRLTAADIMFTTAAVVMVVAVGVAVR